MNRYVAIRLVCIFKLYALSQAILINYSFIRSFVHSFIRSFVHSFIRSFVHSFIRSFVRPFVRSFVRSFIRSFVHSFIIGIANFTMYTVIKLGNLMISLLSK